MLSISIVTFNCQKTIPATLSSLQRHLPERFEAQLVVVDNRSVDDTPFLLRACAEGCKRFALIENAVNVGYGRAHNQALHQVSSRYHIICNPDILFTEDVFTPLVGFMEQFPGIGIICPRFVHLDGSLQPLNRRNPTVMDLFLRRFLPEGLKPLFRERLDTYEMRDVGYEAVCDVPFMTGAFMCCRTDVLKAIGGFDERFFLYFEDADLSLRVQQFGFRTAYFPEACVTHAWERMAHRNWRMAWVFSISAWRYFRKWGLRLW
jgi:GT2 family glycosyltransferase